jgi:hypothetical protein
MILGDFFMTSSGHPAHDHHGPNLVFFRKGHFCESQIFTKVLFFPLEAPAGSLSIRRFLWNQDLC